MTEHLPKSTRHFLYRKQSKHKKTYLNLNSLKKLRKIKSKLTLISLGLIIIITPLIYTSLKNINQAEAAWLDSNWQYRKQLVFNNADQAENLTNFPVMIKLNSSNFNFNQAQTNGADLRFTDSNGTTELSYEIESYNSTSEEAIIWVNVPQIDASSSTDHIYMYYGNPSATDKQNANNTWNSNYKAVYHLDESSDTTVVTDSTANANHLTASQKTSNYTADGKILNSFQTMGTPQVIPNQPDSTSELYPSLKLDANDYPVIAIYDDTQDDLVLIHCNDKECKGNNENISVIDSTGDVGAYPSLQLDTNGYPVIAYYDTTNTNLKIVHCGNANCSSGNTINTIDSTGTVGLYPILQLDASGNPVIAYYDSTNTAVKLAHCSDQNCSNSVSIVFVDNEESDGNYFHGTSMVLDANGYPVLSYYDTTNADLKLTHCGDANCSSGNTTVRVHTTNDGGRYTSLKLDGNGYPMIAYTYTTGSDLYYVHCSDANCSTPPTPVVLNTSYGTYPWMQLDGSGNPIIVWSYNNFPRITICSNTDCTTDTENYVTTYTKNGSTYPVMELDSQGYPVIVEYSNPYNSSLYDVSLYRFNPKLNQSYDPDFNFGTGSFSVSMWFKSTDDRNGYLMSRYDVDQGFKIWLDYGGHPCFGTDDDSTWTPDDYACVAQASTTFNADASQAGDPNGIDMVLDTSGYPVIAYYDDTPDDLEIVHCNDPNCDGVGENYAVIDTTGSVGLTPSLVLDGSGFPVIAYHDNTNQKLKIAHCGDANCSSGNVVNTIPDASADEGDYPSLQLDSSGYPVIAYYDTTNTAIKLVHCNDPNCDGVGETVVMVDNAEADRPYGVDWMKLDTSGFPVMAYYNDTADDLKITRCNDAYCSDKTTVTLDSTGNVGSYAALQLDSQGFPVITYSDATNQKTKLVRCLNADCSSKNINTVRDGFNYYQGGSGSETYIRLNSSGYPVILHASTTRYSHLITTCNDLYCAGSDEQTTEIYSTELYHSLELDSQGYPAIAFSYGNDIGLVRSPTAVYTDTNAYDDGNWHHLVAVKTSASNLKVYIDGVLSATDSTINGGGTLTSDSAELRLGENIMKLSNYVYSVDNFDGQIDEVQIDNTARSAAWVAAQYKSESNTFVNFGESQSTNPIAYWKLDEGTGSTAYDTAGNNYHGSLGSGSSAPTWLPATDCVSDKCLSFDGGDYINIGNTISDIKTVSFWIYPTTETTSILELNGSNTITITSNVISANNFSTPTIYVNGITTTTLAINTWQHVEITTNTGISGTTINFGKVGANFFQGKIDEIKFYTYPRSAEQVKTDYNSRGSIGGTSVRLGDNNKQDTRLNDYLVAHYRFDEGYGNTVNNLSQYGSVLNGSFGTGSSAPSWTNEGKFGKALNFDGNDYISITDRPYFDIGSSGFTYSAWIKITGNYTAQSYNMFMGHYLPYFCVRNSGKLFVSFSDGTQRSLTGNTILNTNEWYYAVATYDNQGYLKLYLNGKLDGTIGPYGNSSNPNSNFYIGTWYSGRDYLFPGLIDEVKIYSRALTENEVKLDYNQGYVVSMGSISSGIGNTSPSTSASQTYCVPGDTATCSSPIAEYNFDEITGSTAYDKSGNNNHGILAIGNSSPQWTYGKIGGAVKFDGNNDYISMGDTLDAGTASLTITAWIKTTDTSGNTMSIAGKPYFGSKQGRYALYMSNNSLKVITQGNVGNINPISNISVNDGNWHFVVGVIDRNMGNSIYVDNVLAGTAPGNTTGEDWNTSDIFSIGIYDGGGRVFNGLIDQVRIYNYARTPAQIAWDYNRGAPVTHYKLDECQGTTVNSTNDPYNSLLNGTINIGASGTQNTAGTCGVGSTASTWSNGKNGKYSSSLNFDGTDDYVDMGNISIFDIPASKQITVSAWFNASATGSDKRIVDNTNNGNGYALSLNSTTPTFIVGNGTAYQSLGTTGFSASTGVWYHLVGTFNDGVQKIYLNGIERNSNTIAGTFTTDPGVTFKVGTRSTNQYFTGQIDDIRIYNYPLTNEQVKTLYNSGAIFFGPSESQ